LNLPNTLKIALINYWRANHCHIVETSNESDRFLHSPRKAKSQIKAREQSRKGGVKEEEIQLPTKEPF